MDRTNNKAEITKEFSCLDFAIVIIDVITLAIHSINKEELSIIVQLVSPILIRIGNKVSTNKKAGNNIEEALVKPSKNMVKNKYKDNACIIGKGKCKAFSSINNIVNKPNPMK